MGDSALPFRIDQSVDNAWGITYLYGCTALMISDPDFVIGTHYGPCHKPHPTIVSFALLLLIRCISCSHAASISHGNNMYQRYTNAK